MVGVKLMSSSQKTRKLNCDELQTRVKDTTGDWKGGKFMPLTSRPHSINTYCLSKILFRCSSINLRVCDLTKISSHIKSWLYADQLEKPEEVVLYRSRKLGGLGLVNLQYKALSLMIRNFLETALNPAFQANKYHSALFSWYVYNKRDITCPAPSPYYDTTFFDSIRQIKEEGLLNISKMSSGMWYRALLENNVTHLQTNVGIELQPCRIELKHPEIDWKRSLSLAATPGLSSKHLTFLWRMAHDLLPTQARLFRLNMPNINSEICSHCNLNIAGDLTHSLLLCPYNDGAGQFLLSKLSTIQIFNHIKLDLNVGDCQLPLVFLCALILKS